MSPRSLGISRPAAWLVLAFIAACATADHPTELRSPSDSALRAVGPSGSVVISQIYGGGGNAGATLRNDFIEIFNATSIAVDLTGWSVQYASSAGTTWQVTALSGTIAPFSYYLIQEAAGSGGTVSLPTPDASGTIAMSGTAGKVALAQQTTALTGACPTGANVNVVSFGTAANCNTTTATLSNTTAAIRKAGGCTDTGVTSADFEVLAPNPRNSAAPVNTCSITTGPITSVTVSPPTSTVFVNTTTTFTASATDASSNPVTTTFTWTSSNTTVATVDANGVATGAAAGTATITATAPNGVAGSANLTVSAAPSVGNVVISQAYGGGGNSGATFTNDYVELFNAGTQAASIGGMTLQYSPAGGTTWTGVVTLPTATIAAGGYYLVQLASQAAVGAPLPTPDANLGTINMSGTTGKVILVAAGVTPTGACPTGVGIVDRLGYGTTSNCATDWGGTTSNLSNTTAAFRKNDGCVNTGSVSSDFVVQPTAPRNSASPTKSCVVGPLDHVAISGTLSVPAGSTTQLTATPQDASNNTVSPATVTWTSSDPNVATVSATGLVTGVAANGIPVTITATAVANGITKSNGVEVTVTNPGGINWIDISSSSASFPPGFQTQLFATARVASGGTIVDATFAFEALDPGIATIANVVNTGLITGVSASATRPRFRITATPVGGGTPYVFTTTPVTIETPNSAPTSIYATNDEFGDPTAATVSNPNDMLIMRPQYVLSYNQSRGTPNWVSYELDARQMVPGQDRCNCFTADPLLPSSAQIFTSDYTNGGFDRGHMTRSADRTAGNVDNAITFYLTNVVPQFGDLNQGVWAQFENSLADSARAGRAVYVITGPLYSRTHGLTFIKNEGKIAIPDSTWKIAVIGPDPGGVPFTRANVQTLSDLANVTVLAVNMPNVAGIRNNPWQQYVTTVSKIEDATGYNFLSLLNETVECRIEVRNCVPEAHLASASGQTSVAVNTLFTLNIGAVDADGADGPWKLAINWGDGTTYSATWLALPTDARPFGRGKTWATPGVYNVIVTLTDKRGAVSTSSLQVTVTP